MGLGRQWNARRVVAHNRKDELQDWIRKYTDAVPGEDGFIAVYQRALSDYMEQLPADELDELEVQAERWNNSGPPMEVKKM